MAEQSASRWGHVEEILAQIAERADMLLRVTVLSNRDPKKTAPNFGPQYRYPRPGQPEEKVAVVRPGQLFASLIKGGD